MLVARDMRNYGNKFLFWILGIGLFAAAVYLVGLNILFSQILRLDSVDVISWIVITLVIRMAMSETLILPLRSIDVSLSRAQAFWLGWLRTLFNQIIPASGLAYTAAYLRRDTQLAWSEVASIGAPQLLLAMQAVSWFGVVTTILNLGRLDQAAFPLVIGFVGMGCFSLVLYFHLDSLLKYLPSKIRFRLKKGMAALRVYRQSSAMTWKVLGAHSGIVFLRGSRLWLLCTAVGISVPVEAPFLFAALGSMVLLAQLTPGGLGLMEGAIVGGGILLGIDPAAIGSVAIIDRALTVTAVLVLSPVSYWWLHQKR